MRQQLPHLVYIIGNINDEIIAMSARLRSSGCQTRAFETAVDFLSALSNLRPGTLLQTSRDPGGEVIQFLQELQSHGVAWPLILLTGQIDVRQAVKLMKSGVFDIVVGDYTAGALLPSVTSAYQIVARISRAGAREDRARHRLEALSSREMEVLRALLAGASNKRVAEALELSVRTVEWHRKNAFDHLGVTTLIEAFRLTLEAGGASLDEEAA